MKARISEPLVERLAELSEEQRAALVAALAGKGSATEAVALMETRFAAVPFCDHCGSEQFGAWGRASGLRRYKCRDCGRTFNALTGTPLAQLRRRDAWLDYSHALVDRVSLRRAADRADVSLDTSFRWRHRFLTAAKGKRFSAVSGIVQTYKTLIFKLARGSKRLVGWAPRKRGGKLKKTGISPDDYDIVLIVRDRRKTTSDHELRTSKPRAWKPFTIRSSAATACSSATAGRATSPSRMIGACCTLPLSQSRLSVSTKASTSITSTFMPKYLSSYLRWRRSAGRDGDRLTPRHMLAEAMS
jgi:transposase-like protein